MPRHMVAKWAAYALCAALLPLEGVELPLTKSVAG